MEHKWKEIRFERNKSDAAESREQDMQYLLTALSGWKMYDAGELSTIKTLLSSLPSLLRS